MIEDLSDAIAELASGTYTVKRSAAPVSVNGVAYPSVVAPAWTATTAYTLGQQVNNGGQAYEVTTAGTSGSGGGPTGTGAAFADGSVVWKWIGPAATTFEITASIQPVSGRELDRLAELYRTREVQTVFTAAELRGSDSTQEPDEITVDGDQWQVQSVANWSTLAGFRRAVIARIGQ